MTYGALCTKVRALYGKRLRTGDFQQLATMKRLEDILDFLRRHPGWHRAMARLDESSLPYIGRIEVEAALWEELRLEYLSLYHFVPRQDRALMDFRVRLAEREAILSSLRRLRTGKYAKERSSAPRIFLQGKIDYNALRAAASYDDVLAAARSTIFYPTLLHLRPGQEGALPDYTVAEALLEAAYFSYMFRLIQTKYTGHRQKVLLQAFGEQVDLLNLIHILRLNTYFPDTPLDTYLTVLYPFNHRLSPEMTRALCAAPGPEETMALIRQTPYANEFEHVEVGAVEDYYRRAFYRFNRRQLLTGGACVYTPMAYLNMKESELQVLVNVIESVKYGVPHDAELAALVGA